MTGRCYGYSTYQQPYYSYQTQPVHTPQTFHNPTITSTRELSGGRHEIRFSAAPSGQLISLLTNGRTFTDGSSESGSHSFNIADNLVSYGSFSSSGFVIRREGNEFVMTIGSNLTGGHIQIGNHTINIANLRNSSNSSVTSELQQGSTAPSTQSSSSTTQQSTPTVSQDPYQRILDGLSVTPRTPTTEQPYGGVIAFDAPVGTVSIRYEAESGNGNFTFTRNHPGGPLESNIDGVAYIQAAPNAYRQVGSGCGSYLVPTQNHFGIGINPNFRGSIIVTINGRERRITYPPTATPLNLQMAIPIEPPVPQLANPIEAPGTFTAITPANVPILATTNGLVVPGINSQNIQTAIANFSTVQNSFPSTLERGSHWPNTNDRSQRRAIASFMRQYATNIANAINPNGPNIQINDRSYTPAEASEYFRGIATQYQGIYSSYGL